MRKPSLPSGVLELVQALEVERQRALGAVDLPREVVLPAGAEARSLHRADRAVREPHDRLDRVVDVAAGDERLRDRRHLFDLADQVAREVDHVRAEVAERARPREVLLEAPDVALGRAPLLQIGAAEVLDVAELAGLDDLARQPDRRHEAVVERAHVLDAGRLHALPRLVGLGGVAPQRLLADHVLARLGGRDRRLGVQVVRPRVVEQLDPRVARPAPSSRSRARRSRSGAPPPTTASSLRPAIATSCGISGGGQVM